MSELDPLTDAREKASVLLDRLAASLGCTTEAFSRPASNGPSQTLELLQCWLEIDDPRGRAKGLSYIRGLAAGSSLLKLTEPPLASAFQKPEPVAKNQMREPIPLG